MSARRRKLAIAGGAIAVVAAGAAVAVSGTSSGTSSANAANTSTATATIERRDLIQTDDQPGTLGYRDSRSAYSAVGGTVTWLPARPSKKDETS